MKLVLVLGVIVLFSVCAWSLPILHPHSKVDPVEAARSAAMQKLLKVLNAEKQKCDWPDGIVFEVGSGPLGDTAGTCVHGVTVFADVTKEHDEQMGRALTIVADPIDVPAIQENRHTKCVPPVIGWGGGGHCERYEDEMVTTCVDKSRILLTAEDGTKHCIKFH